MDDVVCRRGSGREIVQIEFGDGSSWARERERDGGRVECYGGQGEEVEGRRAVKAMNWCEVGMGLEQVAWCGCYVVIELRLMKAKVISLGFVDVMCGDVGHTYNSQLGYFRFLRLTDLNWQQSWVKNRGF